MSLARLKKINKTQFELNILVSLLTKHKGNVSDCAREAEMDRSNFHRLLRKHKLNPETFREQIRYVSHEKSVSKIKSVMKKTNLNQKELGKKIKFCQSYVSKLLRGDLDMSESLWQELDNLEKNFK